MDRLRRILNPNYLIFWGIALAALTYGQFVSFGVAQGRQSPGSYDGQCCRYSSDCSGNLICKTPPGWAPCSSGSSTGYCMLPC